MNERFINAYWSTTNWIERAASYAFNTFVDWISPPTYWVADVLFYDIPDRVMRKVSRSYREKRESELVLSSARIRPEIIEAFEQMRPTTKDPAS